MNIGLLILRAVVGALFIGHGTQKLFGWFGGGGRRGTGEFFHKVGFRPGPAMATLGGLGETTGGTLLVLGFVTPAGAAMIIGVMTSASLAVHRPNGLWNGGGGFELPLVYATTAATLALTGPGRWSIDRLLGWDLSGIWWGIAAIGLGFVCATGVLAWRAMVLRREQQRGVGIPEMPAERKRHPAA
jgi:putative oxidoreductase